MEEVAIVNAQIINSHPPHVFADKSCQVCGIGDIDEDWILICDCCDQEYHTYCLKPVIHEIPTGDWFCPLCSTTGRTTELQTYFATHAQMQRKMKTAGAHQVWRRRRQVAWAQSLEAEGYTPRAAAAGPEFEESEDLIGQLVLLHTDVHTVHTGLSVCLSSRPGSEREFISLGDVAVCMCICVCACVCD